MKVTVEKTTLEEVMREAFSETAGGREIKASTARLYASMHSPIRTQMFKVTMKGIYSFVSVHFVRHNVGVLHTVESLRVDRGGKGDEGRYTPVSHVMRLNAESLIRIAHKRLCGKASPETREVMALIKEGVALVDPDLAPLMVPLCVYRNGLCDELPKPCGFNRTIQPPKLTPHPAPLPGNLHPLTAALVERFSAALAAKLRKAEIKYGYGATWAEPGWMDDCRKRLVEHLHKGDPLDVAAFAAFLWHHGEHCRPKPAPLPGEVGEAASRLDRSLGYGRYAHVTASDIRTILTALSDLQAQVNGVGMQQYRRLESRVADLQEQLAAKDAEIAKLRKSVACATCIFRPTADDPCPHYAECRYGDGTKDNCWESDTPLELLAREESDE